MFPSSIFNSLGFAIILVFASNFAHASDINDTTSRKLRTDYMCRVATEPGHKPLLNGWDNLRISPINYAYADLYGDGIIDLVAGFSDEPYRVNPRYGLSEFYKGNEIRSRKPFQYSFYSPDTSFEVPDSTRFNLARTIVTQDYNGDGIDDMVFIQTGTDYAPYTPWRNEIMLSSPTGYTVSYLPGPRSKYHGGASGDIDNDGDIDIIAGPNANGSVVSYINDGKGKFRYSVAIPRTIHNPAWNSFLWDIDGDNYLDLIAINVRYGVDVHWGNKGTKFSKNPAKIILGENRQTAHDVEFGDFNNDGVPELVFLSSEGLSAKDQTPYSGWSLKSVEFDGRKPSGPVTLDGVLAKTAGFHWMARFAACDLKNDGLLDLVYEHHGEQSPYYMIQQTGSVDNDWTRADKLVWLNQGDGSFSRFRIENPLYFDKAYAPTIDEMARVLGVTTASYRAPQTYFPHDEGIDFVLYAKRNSQPYPLRKLNDDKVLEELVYNICETPEGKILPEEICDYHGVTSTLLRLHEELNLPFAQLPKVKRFCWDILTDIELFEGPDGDCNPRN